MFAFKVLLVCFRIWHLRLKEKQMKLKLRKVEVKSLPNNKQLLDEVEHDIMNYQSRGLCYLPKPKAEADNTDTRV